MKSVLAIALMAIFLCSLTTKLTAQSFVEVRTPFDSLHRIDACWGDYDSDHDLDLIVCGDDESFQAFCEIFRNDGDAFVGIDAGLLPANEGSVEWGDYDNDGDLDIVTGGYDGSTYTTVVYRNDGGDTFVNIEAGITGFSQGSVEWGDYDNDGDPDILLTGRGPGGFFTTRTLVYRNDGEDNFVQLEPGFFNLYDGEGRWGDYDQDGDLDILVTGSDSTAGMFYTFVYRNDGGDAFTDIHATIEGAGEGSSVALGDFDNDGDLDAGISSILSTGGFPTAVYRYEADSTYVDVVAEIDVGCCGSVSWADYDNDDDLDFLATGYFRAQLYRNDSTSANTPPAVPAGLQSTVNGSDVTLSWQPSSDSETDSPGLTYNIRIGTNSGGVDVLSPMSDPATGERKIVAMGNAYQNTSWTIRGLPDGTYFWSVQAIDNAFQGSAFADDHSFTIASGDYVCGDADASGAVDIDDVVYLIAYIFSGGPAPIPLEAGDADCSGGVDIDDAVYLVTFIFSGGDAPCDTDGDGMPDC